jgi:hypothetical protein
LPPARHVLGLAPAASDASMAGTSPVRDADTSAAQTGVGGGS